MTDRARAESAPDRDETIALVLKGYPRLSETFIAQEIHALERRGLRFTIVSLRRPTDAKTHPVHAAIRAPVCYLPEYLYQAPLRVWRGWRAARRLPGYRAALRAWLRDWRRDPTPNRGRRFGQALVLAAELDGLAPADRPIRRFYVHFLHTPGSVTRYAALMRGLPWSGSAHAKDIWTIPAWEKREKLAEADWIATCTAVGRDHLATLAPSAERVRLVYHGLDLAALPPPPTARPDRLGDSDVSAIHLVSVGRFVPKKGYDILLSSLATLKLELSWKLIHIGGGAGRSLAEKTCKELKIADRIQFMGSQTRDRVFALLAEGDLFILPSRVAPDGDRDGLPNVLMEAASQKLCIVSTSVSAIPEFIEHDRNGWLVPPDDPAALSDAIRILARDPDRRRRLGEAAYRTLYDRFSMDGGIDALAGWLTSPHAPATDAAQAAD